MDTGVSLISLKTGNVVESIAQVTAIKITVIHRSQGNTNDNGTSVKSAL